MLIMAWVWWFHVIVQLHKLDSWSFSQKKKKNLILGLSLIFMSQQGQPQKKKKKCMEFSKYMDFFLLKIWEDMCKSPQKMAHHWNWSSKLTYCYTESLGELNFLFLGKTLSWTLKLWFLSLSYICQQCN